MTPLGWGWAGFVWGYALQWFLVNDNLKLLAYRIFDPAKTVANPEAKLDAIPETGRMKMEMETILILLFIVAFYPAKAEPKPDNED